jgi:hypothetical protein
MVLRKKCLSRMDQMVCPPNKAQRPEPLPESSQVRLRQVCSRGVLADQGKEGPTNARRLRLTKEDFSDEDLVSTVGLPPREVPPVH